MRQKFEQNLSRVFQTICCRYCFLNTACLELTIMFPRFPRCWLLLCIFVSQIIPQGVAPAPCIPCCLVLTDRKLLTCHQDCQTSFFRSLGGADLNDVTAVCLEEDKEYCVIVRVHSDSCASHFCEQMFAV